MSKRRYDKETKPIDEWGVEEWKQAYEVLNKTQTGLKLQLKQLFIYLHRALGKLQEIIN